MGEFHNLNLVFHNQILVSGPRKHFHSIQHVRIMLCTNFGALRMPRKITPFFLHFCHQNGHILPSAPEGTHIYIGTTLRGLLRGLDGGCGLLCLENPRGYPYVPV